MLLPILFEWNYPLPRREVLRHNFFRDPTFGKVSIIFPEGLVTGHRSQYWDIQCDLHESYPAYQ